MKNVNPVQKEIKMMFDTLNAKNISSRKYESLLQEIGRYAESKNEGAYLKSIVRDELLKSMGA